MSTLHCTSMRATVRKKWQYKSKRCVFYLNSQEVFRSNLVKPSTYSTQAKNDVTGPDGDRVYEDVYLRCLVAPSLLEPGENANVVAVEVHQASSQFEADLSFDLSLDYFTNNWASE